MQTALRPIGFRAQQRDAHRVVAGKLRPREAEPAAQPRLFRAFQQHAPQQRRGCDATRKQRLPRSRLLARSGDQWLLTDLDSTNGTKLAGSRVSGTVLVPTFTPVTIGTTTFELRP